MSGLPRPSYASFFGSGCAEYLPDIRAATDRWWADLRLPQLWEAQIIAESNCDPAAVSGVGAAGLVQLMPLTSQQYARKLGFDPYTSPHVAKFAIPAGAAFMADLRRQWNGRGRTPVEAHWPAVASYNRGLGNILADQRECADARLWDGISACTGVHTQETVNYVLHIRAYWQRLGGSL